MTIMSLSLPDAITTYFSISNGADASLIADCFTQDACVLDEGETHRYSSLDARHPWQD
tara:strand:+ start:58 stop:231 length:174 start_codon:yes stop_codon:yes gene_type:complete